MKRLLLGIGLVLAAQSAMAQAEKDHNFTVAKNLDVFHAIYKNLDLMYVDTLDADNAVGTGVGAMLKALDPYTVYYPEDKVKDS